MATSSQRPKTLIQKMFEDAEKTFAFRPTYEERLEILAEFLHVPHSQVQNVQRAVAIPRTSLDKCDICGSAEDLRICSRCVSKIYCSTECQKKDWKTHKATCKRSLAIDICTFYPFLAHQVDYMRFATDSPLFPAVNHPTRRRKINSSRSQQVQWGDGRNDGSDHTTITFGRPHALDEKERHAYWKTQFQNHPRSEHVRMAKRGLRETCTLEVNVGIVVALLSEVYSFYYIPGNDKGIPHPHSKRYHLQYKNTPIADFGICKGKIRGGRKKLQTWSYSYQQQPEGSMHAHPNIHYWIYFTTIKGEDITLDCSAFPYGMEALVDASHCLDEFNPDPNSWPGSKYPPAYLRSSRQPVGEYRLIEEKRFSFLRYQDLVNAFTYDAGHLKPNTVDNDVSRALWGYMAHIVEGDPGGVPLAVRMHISVRTLMRPILQGDKWQEWTKPQICREDLW